MAKEFKGKIELDIRDSTPDWDAFLADKAPEGAPNVLVVLYDDTGLAALPFGGRIEMPTLKGLADNGLSSSQWHTTATRGRSRFRSAPLRPCAAVRSRSSRRYDGGDAVSSEHKPTFEWTGGRIVKAVFDVADDKYVDVERYMAAAIARD